MSKKILFSVMAILLAVGLVGAGAFAYFSDTATTGDNVFQAGTVDISLGGSLAASLVCDNMAPGQTVTGIITVTNGGSLDLKYGMYTTFHSAPLMVLGLFDVKITDAGEVIIYEGGLDYATFGVTSGPPSLKGVDGGDSRLLASGASETLTFDVTLPFDTSNDYQGLSSTVNFHFLAEQTANNP